MPVQNQVRDLTQAAVTVDNRLSYLNMIGSDLINDGMERFVNGVENGGERKRSSMKKDLTRSREDAKNGRFIFSSSRLRAFG